jgi:hypothetical protein
MEGFNPMTISADTVFSNLQKIDQVDPVTSAIYREQAQEVLATPSITLKLRSAIADRLNRANNDLALHTVGSEDSY